MRFECDEMQISLMDGPPMESPPVNGQLVAGEANLSEEACWGRRLRVTLGDALWCVSVCVCGCVYVVSVMEI